MTVYDKWHTKSGDEPCREHSRGRARLYPSAVHGTGDRWQVRWYDDQGRQRKRNFALKEGRDPSRHAEAFDAKITRDLHTGEYADPAADVTLQAYAEDWRKTRRHDTVTAEAQERRLRLHVYEDPAAPGRTPRGGVAIGQRKLRELARRPSLVAAWRGWRRCRCRPRRRGWSPMTCRRCSAPRSMTDWPAVTRCGRRPSPVRSAGARRRGRGHLEGGGDGRAALPPRFELVPWLGAGTGMRQGELFGLAVDDIAFSWSRQPARDGEPSGEARGRASLVLCPGEEPQAA